MPQSKLKQHYKHKLYAPHTKVTTEEVELILDIKQHELTHQNFLFATIKVSAIQNLDDDLSPKNFNSRTSEQRAPKTVVDLGVSTFIGSAQLIQSMNYIYNLQ